MTVAWVPIVALLLRGGGPEIFAEGDTECPTPQEVAGRLLPLLPVAAPGTTGAPVWLSLVDVPASGTGAPAAVEIRVRLAGDATAERREVPRGRSCHETADVLAVIAATWLGPPLRDDTRSGSTVAAARPPLASAAIPAVDVETAATDSAARAQARPAPRASSSLVLSVGAGAGIATSTEGGGAPFGRLVVDAWRSGGRWFAQLAMTTVAERTVPFTPGRAAWHRSFGLVGGGRTWERTDLRFELAAGLAAGAVSMAGRDLGIDRSTVSLDIGVASELRVGGRIGQTPLAAWIAGGFTSWLRPHRIWADGAPASRNLPWIDAQLGGGLAWVLGR